MREEGVEVIPLGIVGYRKKKKKGLQTYKIYWHVGKNAKRT